MGQPPVARPARGPSQAGRVQASAEQARGAEQPRRGAARSLRQRLWETELRVACGAAPMGRPPVARPARGPAALAWSIPERMTRGRVSVQATYQALDSNPAGFSTLTLVSFDRSLRK